MSKNSAEILLSFDSSSNWIHTDRLGSGHKMTNTSGTVVFTEQYDPHGQKLLQTSNNGAFYLSKKFTGYERDAGTNTDNAKARQYQHNNGRFMQPDPLSVLASDPSNPQSLNLYSYVQNDPINAVDPSGMTLQAIWGRACSGTAGDEICEWYIVGYVDIGGGGGGTGISDPNQGGTGGDFTPPTAGDALKLVEEKLKDKDGKCAGLFSKANGLDILNKSKNKITSKSDFPIDNYNGKKTNFNKEPQINAATDKSGNITLNSGSRIMTGFHWDPANAKGLASKYFKQVNPIQALAAVIIHELLHVSGDFPFEKYENESFGNNAEVLQNCFGVKP